MVLSFDQMYVFRCEGRQLQLPGPVGVRQWYHCADSTRVQSTQLSGLPALLRGNTVKWRLRHVCCAFIILCYSPSSFSYRDWERVEAWKGNASTAYACLIFKKRHGKLFEKTQTKQFKTLILFPLLPTCQSHVYLFNWVFWRGWTMAETQTACWDLLQTSKRKAW